MATTRSEAAKALWTKQHSVSGPTYPSIYMSFVCDACGSWSDRITHCPGFYAFEGSPFIDFWDGHFMGYETAID